MLLGDFPQRIAGSHHIDAFVCRSLLRFGAFRSGKYPRFLPNGAAVLYIRLAGMTTPHSGERIGSRFRWGESKRQRMTGEQLGGIQHHISTPDDTIAAEFVSGAAGGQRDLVGFPAFQRLTVGNKIAGFVCDGDRYIIVGSLYGLRLRLNAGGEPRPCCPGQANHAQEDSKK